MLMGMLKYLTLFLLVVMLAAGGCERGPEHKLAQVDLELLLAESEQAASLQDSFAEREDDFADYYQSLDIAGSETGEQHSVYQRYLEMVEERQQELDDLIARAIESLDKADEYEAVVTADTAYQVSADITLEVAAAIDNLDLEQTGETGSEDIPAEDESRGENNHE